jgi:enoyl-CoA hydratase/carnithine racemase
MTSTEARREDDGGVVTVTLTRDEKMNAMTPEMFDVIEDAVRDLGDRDDLRVLVISPL